MDPHYSKDQFDMVCEFTKGLSELEFEVKILILDLERERIDKFNTDQFFDKIDGFIEVVADKLDTVEVF